MSEGGILAPSIQYPFSLALFFSGIYNRVDKCRVYIDSDCEYEVMYCQSYLTITSQSIVYAIIKVSTQCSGRTIIYDSLLTYFNGTLSLNTGVNVIQIHLIEPSI